MGFAKFLSPRRIKLARGTARDLKLELAAADTAKFSFTLEGLRFAGNLDLKRDGLYLPIREGDELAVIYEVSSSNSGRSALRGENSAPRPNCEVSSSGNSAAANSNRDAYSDTAASARQNSTASDLSNKDRSGINSAALSLIHEGFNEQANANTELYT